MLPKEWQDYFAQQEVKRREMERFFIDFHFGLGYTMAVVDRIHEDLREERVELEATKLARAQ